MIYYEEEIIDKLAIIIKKMRDYNLKNFYSGTLEKFIHDIEVLVDKGKITKN